MCRINNAAFLSDPHSAHKLDQPKPVHADVDITVDFENRQLRVREVITFDTFGFVNLDYRGQEIISIMAGGSEVGFARSGEDEVVGSDVCFHVPYGKVVEIVSSTSPDALGLQWLTPEQAQSDHPLLYSQFETINGRSALVMADAPNIRFKHTVTIRVPKALRGLIAAGEFKERTEEGEWAVEKWEMNTPVPLYLFAINVGDFVHHAFDERTGVWADRRLIDKAKIALARTPDIMATLEDLFGPYQWGNYDTVVLPALGYPFGAMEHPCLTSMNAMLIENEYAATRVTIHEMTHSWFGNLITNAHWGDFWLNEGLTTFGEWLAIRELLGEESMIMQVASSIAELEKAISKFIAEGKPEFTCLKIDLKGINPDDSFSRVPYYKGGGFMWRIMEVVGEREMFNFLRDYIASFRYTSVDTEQFLEFLTDHFGVDILAAIDITTWIYEPGMPADMPEITSAKAEHIAWLGQEGRLPDERSDSWGFQEFDLYFSKLTRSAPISFYGALRRQYGEILENGMLAFEYLHACLEAPAVPVDTVLPAVETFLCSYGRQVYVIPLYDALCARGQYDDALRIFKKAAAGYHPIARDQVRKRLFDFEQRMAA